jgi:hypothetical protein
VASSPVVGEYSFVEALCIDSTGSTLFAALDVRDASDRFRRGHTIQAFPVGFRNGDIEADSQFVVHNTVRSANVAGLLPFATLLKRKSAGSFMRPRSLCTDALAPDHIFIAFEREFVIVTARVGGADFRWFAGDAEEAGTAEGSLEECRFQHISAMLCTASGELLVADQPEWRWSAHSGRLIRIDRKSESARVLWRHIRADRQLSQRQSQ